MISTNTHLNLLEKQSRKTIKKLQYKKKLLGIKLLKNVLNQLPPGFKEILINVSINILQTFNAFSQTQDCSYIDPYFNIAVEIKRLLLAGICAEEQASLIMENGHEINRMTLLYKEICNQLEFAVLQEIETVKVFTIIANTPTISNTAFMSRSDFILTKLKMYLPQNSIARMEELTCNQPLLQTLMNTPKLIFITAQSLSHYYYNLCILLNKLNLYFDTYRKLTGKQYYLYQWAAQYNTPNSIITVN